MVKRKWLIILELFLLLAAMTAAVGVQISGQRVNFVAQSQNSK
jgi:P pilus assembly chaperone PapD